MNMRLHNLAPRYRHRGMALLMVLMAVGVASILGMTLLYTASLRAQVSGNLGRTLQVRSLADSGINLALHYLRYPNDAPVEFPGTYQLNLSLDEPVRLLISVSELSPMDRTFRITSTAQIPPGGGGLSHTSVADVKVHEESKVFYGLAHNGNLTLPANVRINGDARVDGSVTLSSAFGNAALITGALYTGGSVSGLILPNILSLPKRPATAAPAFGDLTLIHGQNRSNFTYRLPGSDAVYTAQKIPSPGTTLPATAFGTPSATNPANVWWTDSHLQLENVDFAGTLVIWPSASSDRRLEIRSGTNKLRSRGQLPAVIVRDQIHMRGTASLTVDGLVYTGKGISTHLTSLGPITINGAMLFGEPSATIANTYLGQLTVNYDPQKADVPDLAITGKVPVAVQILAWEN